MRKDQVVQITFFSVMIILFIFLPKILYLTSAQHRYTKKEYKGRVMGKRRDINVHYTHTLVLDDYRQLPIDGWCIGTNLWEFIEVGDSLSKPAGNLLLTVYKASGEREEFEYYVRP